MKTSLIAVAVMATALGVASAQTDAALPNIAKTDTDAAGPIKNRIPTSGSPFMVQAAPPLKGGSILASFETNNRAEMAELLDFVFEGRDLDIPARQYGTGSRDRNSRGQTALNENDETAEEGAATAGTAAEGDDAAATEPEAAASQEEPEAEAATETAPSSPAQDEPQQ